MLLFIAGLISLSGAGYETKLFEDPVALENTFNGVGLSKIIDKTDLSRDADLGNLLVDGFPDHARHHETTVRRGMVRRHYVGELFVGIEGDLVSVLHMLGMNEVSRFHLNLVGGSLPVVLETDGYTRANLFRRIQVFVSKELHAIKVEVGAQLGMRAVLAMPQLPFTSSPQLISGPPQAARENCDDKPVVEVKKFSDLDRQKKGEAISGALFLAYLFGWFTYLLWRQTVGSDDNQETDRSRDKRPNLPL